MCVCFTELAMIEEKGATIRGFIRNAQTACITADSTPPPGVGTCLRVYPAVTCEVCPAEPTRTLQAS